MRLDGFEAGQGDGSLHRLDPRLKLVVTLGFIIAVVLTPLGWWWMLGIEAAVLLSFVALSGLKLIDLAKRWLGFAPLVLFLALVIAPGHPSKPNLGFWPVVAAIVLKNSLAFGAILVLSGVTSFARLLNAMRRLGIPLVLVATLHFMVRYVHVLGDELGRMTQARRARSFRRSGVDYGILTGLIGVLFVRAMERGERVHSAMLARGWDGTIRTLDDEPNEAPG
jgi:cobalt/nickel transport system permease protein